MKVCLDTSVVVKRYVDEAGSGALRHTFRLADSGLLSLVVSLWTVGECLGVFDRLERQRRIPRGDAAVQSRNLLAETTRLSRLGVLSVVPLRARLVRISWKYIPKHRLYAADALQLGVALQSKVDLFLSSDAALLEAAAAEGLAVMNPETQETPLIERLDQTVI